MLNNIKKEIDKLQESIHNKQEELKYLQSLSIDKLVAKVLHEKLCHSNHTDGCSWYYETWKEPGYAKKEYLNKAKEMLKVAESETILQIINCL